MTLLHPPAQPGGGLLRLIASSGLSNLSDGIALVVWAWLATLLTRDPILVALMPVALRLPWFLFALPAGLVADRYDRRRIVLAADAFRAAAFALVALAVWTALPLGDAPTTGLNAPELFAFLIASALLIGAAEVFRDSAAQTMLPSVVPDAELERANGRLWSVELVGNALLGPALGAFLIAWAIWAPFALNALALVAAAAILSGLRGTFRPERSDPRDWRRELREGLSFLAGNPLLRLLAWIAGVWNLLNQMVVIALVLHVQENLGLEAEAYGLILAAGAVGGILGALAADRAIRLLGTAAAAQWMTLLSGACFAAIPLAPGAVTLAAVLFIFEFSGLVWNTVSITYRQRAVPGTLLARVSSIYRLFAWG